MPGKSFAAIRAEFAGLDRLAREGYDLDTYAADAREILLGAVFGPVIQGLAEGRVEMLRWVRGEGDFAAPRELIGRGNDAPWRVYAGRPNAGLLEGWAYLAGLDPETLRADLLRVWDKARAAERKGPVARKRRRHDARRHRAPRAWLDADTVRVLRAKHAAGASFAALAREYDAPPSTIRQAIVGESWKGVV